MLPLEQQIIEQTIRLFQEQGFKFTLDELASRLRISKKTIYQYFSSKEAIFNEVVEYGFAKIQSTKCRILESNLSTVEKLKSVLIAMPQEFEKIDFRELKNLEKMYPSVNFNLQQHFEADWEPIFALIEQGIHEETIRPININVLKMILTAAFEAFMSSDSLDDSGLTYREALVELVEIVMNGLIMND
ncbi:TetR/AcrR family transcriptional regulator [Aerococcaceae bacterium zg-ZUI334]|uniref:TetR/AcrR family transcriptional regulator n=1 Tax=Aerococcaceae bacterium zg-252 TaxID=2796928 RepID=UPI001B917C3A|nr:TetR/AcrR family transcriptional regulator [Aerococcaceae bacterium zg-ZUI334]